MKLLKSLFGNRADKPGLNFLPPAERPAPRSRPPEEDTLPMPARPEPNPFLDDPELNIELAEETLDQLDPYQSHSWKLRPDSDTRKLKALAIGKQTDKSSDGKFNPYDTGTSRRGWKK